MDTSLSKFKDDGERADKNGDVVSVNDEDLKQFNEMSWGSGKTKDITLVWDEDFLAFSKWLRTFYHSRYTRQDFRNIQFRACIDLIVALAALLVTYVYLRVNYFQYFNLWAFPFFVMALWTIQKEEVVHMRAHWPTKMTGSDAFDKGIDYSMMILTGASKETFRRRHVAAHYSDIGNFSRIFSDVWVPFVQLPAIYYFRPFLILKLIMDTNYITSQKLDRTQLIIEMCGLYVYMALGITELFYESYFLFGFHLAPLLFFHGSQILAATIAHAGIDKRNSFNSNGLFDPWECKGLFRVSMVMVDWMSNGGARNHGIHHGYSQAPLELINKDFKVINAHCRKAYKDVRLNEVLAMRVHQNIYESLSEPYFHDYVIQFFLVCGVLVCAVFTVLGLPIPPVQFEPWLVDWRISLPRFGTQRAANILQMWKALFVRERAAKMVNPNAYLSYVLGNLPYFEAMCEASPPPMGYPDLFDKIAPAHVLEANGVGHFRKTAAKKVQ
jgi:hypothetical protein